MCKVSSSVHFISRSSGSNRESARASWVPNTDVYETENGLVVKVELAGMRSDHLEIIVVGNRLHITGERPDGCRAPKCKFLVMEINYGAFESVIELPAGYDLCLAKATYQNGFLRIDVPVVAQTKTSMSVPVTEA